MPRTSPTVLARIAGLLYVVTIAGGFFAEFVIGSALIVRNDAAATATRILASESLYRVGLAAEFAGILAYVAVTALLYILLRPVGRTLALLAAFFSLVGCAVGAMKLAFHLVPLVLLHGAPFLNVFSAGQLQALSLLFLKLEGQTNTVGLVFFGFYCVMTGWLILRAQFLPRVIGLAMIVAGLCWLIASFALLLAPPLGTQLFPLNIAGILGEGSLTLWLLVFGVDAAKWHQRAGDASP